MGTLTLVTGGARSGKTAVAEGLADSPGGRTVCYVATAEARDDEMRDRIERHREDRPDGWETIEEPRNLPGAVVSAGGRFDSIIVDCLTIWISNRLEDGASAEKIVEDVCSAADAGLEASADVVFVTNEVGSGIVPANELSRRFRDVAGLVNQAVAARADRVVLCVSGVPVVIKGEPV